jgi:hypothetical protein
VDQYSEVVGHVASRWVGSIRTSRASRVAVRRILQDARRRRRATAAGFAVLGVGELAAWFAFRGAGVLLTTVAVVVGGLAAVALNASGGGDDLPSPARAKTTRARPAPA